MPNARRENAASAAHIELARAGVACVRCPEFVRIHVSDNMHIIVEDDSDQTWSVALVSTKDGALISSITECDLPDVVAIVRDILRHGR